MYILWKAAKTSQLLNNQQHLQCPALLIIHLRCKLFIQTLHNMLKLPAYLIWFGFISTLLALEMYISKFQITSKYKGDLQHRGPIIITSLTHPKDHCSYWLFSGAFNHISSMKLLCDWVSGTWWSLVSDGNDTSSVCLLLTDKMVYSVKEALCAHLWCCKWWEFKLR